MGKQASILMFFGVFYLGVCCAASLNRSDIDMTSLLALKAQINSDILAKNWSQETSFCNWVGVSCGHRHPRVTGLDLSNMGLRGTMAREIGNLSFLTFMDMSSNGVHGPMPGDIANLRRLRVLNMAFNQLSDHIPRSFGILMRNLKSLNLSNNYLNGDIPRSLSLCVELNTPDLSYNNFSGNIPIVFGNLSRLQEFSLRSNQVTGELLNISNLRFLVVGENQLSGSVPKHICSQSTKLEVLGLFANRFEGEFPSAIMHCHSLKVLSLADNKFTGNIPNEFWNSSAIQRVFLLRNRFTGSIPPSIGNLTKLDWFSVMDNSFQGTIPSEIGQLSRLTTLNLNLNKLDGELPQSIFNLSSLQSLSLAKNNLSGNLPPSMDKRLPNIKLIIIFGNLFHGKIPDSISNLSRLNILELSLNSFTGHIPITLGNLRRLQKLSLSENQFTNNLSVPEQDFVSSLTACKYLELIHISGNPITGVLPKSLGLGNLSASLELFLADFCRITSPLPDEIGNLSNLMWLDLAYNDLTGVVPTTMGNLGNLQKLEINGNKLQSSISHVLCNLENLYSMNLAENNFFGQLPMCFGNLSLLREINLADNALNSNIPSTFWFIEQVEKMNFSNNFFDGSLSREIGNLKSLIELDLSGNQVSGEIPSTISQLQNLISLSLSNNKLDGPILESFADMKELQYLDLSHNNLAGPIPKSLEALSNLNYFNVSFNKLSGEIPSRGPFANFTAGLFTGNNGLCGSPRFQVEECKRSMPAPSRKNKLIKYILPVLASVVVIALILILVQRHHHRRSSLSSQTDLPVRLMHERISYYEILRATNNLDEENLIGEGSYGSVYKGNFSDAMFVAVKVFNLDIQGALKSFDTECQIMRSIRHRNLVKVITSCSNPEFKALVMAYMPSGNLEKWLYSANHYLNISERVGIMIDVASALEYLHDGCVFPIVHCDLKPNNILLDEDMVAHVGDFGIAKLLTQEQRLHQTRTLGTIGYMAPEYGLEGLISTKVDVYSYGILLMEILSRRKPTDEMFSGELNMRRWAFESFPSSVMQVVDDDLLDMNEESIGARSDSCLTSIIRLALECTMDLPEQRPNMKDILARIKKIKLNLSNHN